MAARAAPADRTAEAKALATRERCGKSNGRSTGAWAGSNGRRRRKAASRGKAAERDGSGERGNCARGPLRPVQPGCEPGVDGPPGSPALFPQRSLFGRGCPDQFGQIGTGFGVRLRRLLVQEMIAPGTFGQGLRCDRARRSTGLIAAGKSGEEKRQRQKGEQNPGAHGARIVQSGNGGRAIQRRSGSRQRHRRDPATRSCGAWGA